MEKSSGKMVVYQMLPRLFGNKKTTNTYYGTLEENGVGKFKDINTVALKSILTWVFLMCGTRESLNMQY